MRTSRILALAAVLGAVPLLATAQTISSDSAVPSSQAPAPAKPETAAPQAPAKPASATSQAPAKPAQAAAAPAEDEPSPFVPATKNIIDAGARFTSVDGDDARYERYPDLSSGPVLEKFRFSKDMDTTLFEAAIDHLGYKDQKFSALFAKPGVFKAWGSWDQIPMLLSHTTQTLFVEDISKSPNVLTIDDAIQSAGQTNAANIGPIFDAKAVTFTTDSWRHIAQGNVELLPTEDWTLRAKLQFTHREGVLPYGGSFGHSSVVEIPAPIDHKTTDFNTSAEYAHGPFLFNMGFNGSWFTNENTTVTWDNPWRVSDSSGVPSRGRESLAPSNTFLTVNGMVGVKLAGHSRLTAYVSTGSLKDVGDPLMPQTINTANTNLTPLPRNTVEGEARTNAVNLTFVSRPDKVIDIDARYRVYDYDNQTPVFVLPQRVSYDNTPAAATFTTLGGATSPSVVETEPFGIKRTSFDGDLHFHTGLPGTTTVGYSYYGDDRTHRFFDATHENIVRVGYDVITTGLFSVRSKYEHGAKRGDVTDVAEQDLFNIGEQPDMRQYDIAHRNRDRVTVLGTYTPEKGTMALSGSIAAGKDDYIESTFGLRDNTNRIYTAGGEFMPRDHVSVGVSYSYEHYNALLRSRQANPPSPTITYAEFVALNAQPSSTVQVADATRNWGNEGTDGANSVLGHLDFTGLRENKIDLHFTYDYNRSRSTYVYTTGPDVPRTLPEETPPPTSTLPPPTQLPPVKSDLQRATAEFVYAINSRLSLGVTWWYEQWRVQDFTLDADANQDLVRGQALLLGYMYRPYSANTGWVRVMYRW